LIQSNTLVGPELIFGLVGATGSNLASVADALTEALSAVGYSCEPETIRVANLLHAFPPWQDLPTSPEDARLNAHMDAGNEFRKLTGRSDAMAVLAIGAIQDNRDQRTHSVDTPGPRQAFVLRSFKHPAEIEALQRVYRRRFCLVGAYASRHDRVENLAARIAQSHHQALPDEHRAAAEALVTRDQDEEGIQYGQHLGDAFPLADVFVNASNPRQMREEVERFIDLLFASPFITPNKHEYSMFLAQAAALRSAQMGRQVGATIVNDDGDVIAVGTNEVPKAGGGAYWSDDENDGRDHVLGYDSADRMKRQMLAEVLEKLSEAGWLKASKGSADIDELVRQALSRRPPGFMRGTQLMNVLEYGRPVHAEMAAVIDAARRGVSVRGCAMYVTTFPCHNCARHIVASGIQRVVYIEPYPKSLASMLHLDAIATDAAPATHGQVEFAPFVGVAPRRFMELFTMPRRKTDDGRAIAWNAASAEPRLADNDLTYLLREREELGELQAILSQNRTMFGKRRKRAQRRLAR
jgi:Deoxycytidylate deaminase